VISAQKVTKQFRPPASLRAILSGRLRGDSVVALAGVDLDVQAGQVVGLMGPNGAGKSTLLRILVGLVTPTTGSASVDGCDVASERRRVAERVGYVAGDERGMTPQLSAREHLRFFAALFGLGAQEGRARGERLLADLSLVDAADRPMGQLSTGMRRRIALARGFLGAPRVLILDEPTRGIDPEGAAWLRGHVARFAQKGGAVVLATHDLEEARTLCQRVGHMERGLISRWDG